jgi:hypothetical protein
VIDVPDPLLLRAARRDADRVAALRLLSDGGESVLERCCPDGRLYVLHDLANSADQAPLGAAVVTLGPDRATAVLGAVVTYENDLALGTRVIFDVLEDQRARGCLRVLAAGGDEHRILLLERSGFRRCAETARPVPGRETAWFERDL